jgi:NAD(P)-dependent dehydrogenase (short-subunit alcohol dehydrogenase family)
MIPPAAIVTGGSRGIGAAVARMLGAAGYNVAVNFTSDEAAARRVAADIESSGTRAVAIQADVSREDDVLRLFETAERELGPVRALVNNAAIVGGVSRVADVDAGAVARMLAVNVTGTILCAREAVKRMSTPSSISLRSRRARTGAASGFTMRHPKAR